MSGIKVFRYGLWAMVFALGTFLSFSVITSLLKNESAATIARVEVGGDFTALRANGEPITHDNLKGRPHVLFFGFTHCPDICPTTLYEAGEWLKSLGAEGDKLDVYFVTVDPERDTPDILREYLSAFDNRIEGITGSTAQISALARKWRVYSEKVPTGDDDYTVNHTATTFLMKSDGSFFGTIAYGENMDTAKRKLERLMKSESG